MGYNRPNPTSLPKKHRLQLQLQHTINTLEIRGENLEKRIEYVDSTLQGLPFKKTERIEEEKREDTPTPPEVLPLRDQVSSLSEKLKKIEGEVYYLKNSVKDLEKDREDRESFVKIQSDLRAKWSLFTNETKESVDQIKNELTSRIANIVSESNQSTSDLTNHVFKLDDSIQEDKRAQQNLESLKTWYNDLEDEAYKEYLKMYVPTTEKEIISDDLTSKMENISNIVNNLKISLTSRNFTGNDEVLMAVEDFEKNVKGRLNILKGKGGRPIIEKEIMGFDKYKEKQTEELARSLISEKEANLDLDIEKKYREYVEAKYKEYLKEFIANLKKRGSTLIKDDRSQQTEYKEFIEKGLMNLFVNAIDRIKSKNDKKIPQEVDKSLNDIFKIIGIEEIPITTGVTKIDASTQHVQGFKKGNYEDGTVAEVVCRGFKYKETNEIIRKPVVIRGERG